VGVLENGLEGGFGDFYRQEGWDGIGNGIGVASAEAKWGARGVARGKRAMASRQVGRW